MVEALPFNKYIEKNVSESESESDAVDTWPEFSRNREIAMLFSGSKHVCRRTLNITKWWCFILTSFYPLQLIIVITIIRVWQRSVSV